MGFGGIFIDKRLKYLKVPLKIHFRPHAFPAISSPTVNNVKKQLTVKNQTWKAI